MNRVIGILLFVLSPLVTAIDKIPADDATYIYGLGVDIDHNNAQKMALADITQKLSTRVKSQITVDVSKKNQRSSTNASQNTQAISQEIELPNVTVIKNEQKQGQWWVLVRVERKLVQIALKKKLSDISDEITFLLDDYSDSPGPACWFALKENSAKKEQLSALIPTYIGSGVDLSSADEFSAQLNVIEKLTKQCSHKNKYSINFPPNAPKAFQNTIKKILKKNGYKIAKSSQNTGEIDIEFNEKSTIAFKNHLYIIDGQLSVNDENGDLKGQAKFKSKGSSFSSKADANKRALENLTKKMNTLNIK